MDWSEIGNREKNTESATRGNSREKGVPRAKIFEGEYPTKICNRPRKLVKARMNEEPPWQERRFAVQLSAAGGKLPENQTIQKVGKTVNQEGKDSRHSLITHCQEPLEKQQNH